MLDVKTPLSKVHRATRRVESGFVANPGIWAYLESGVLKNIVATTSQEKVLKVVIGNASSSVYESHDVEVGSIATIDEVARMAVDTDGYQAVVGGTGTTATATMAYATAGGDDLTVAYRTTSATAGSSAYSKPADLGKLRFAITGDTVVARSESFSGGLLEYSTVTPYTKA